MLTQDEQEAILRKVRLIRYAECRRRKAVEHGEMSPQRYKELREQEEYELMDLLKEVG